MKLLAMAAALCLLQSCIMMDHDLSGTPAASDMVGKCFALTNDTELFRYKKTGYTYLYSAKLGGMPNPTSPEERARLRYEILPGVLKGTQIVISKVVNVAFGEQGRCLNVYGYFRDRPIGGGEFEIPVCSEIFGGVNQNWLTQSPYEDIGPTKVLHLSERLLTPCGSAAP
jgi:hypothetical protein